MSQTNAPASSRAGAPSVGSNPTQPPVDIQQLADRVYRLFLADLSVQVRRATGERR